ncbi:YncE family protein, partial [Nocardioides sp.]|uniref:YncE family protein n=1 Tax=Nocardioides sp. TaxID=35761 RepID=UPI0027496AC8|nr:hypothetical protein [Nocardioides sp.]
GSALSVIDAGTMEVVADVATGLGPQGIVVTEDESSAWVTNTVDGTVTAIDLRALRAVATYPVGDRPNGITLALSSVTGADAETPLMMPARYAPVPGGGHDEHAHEEDESSSEHHD